MAQEPQGTDRRRRGFEAAGGLLREQFRAAGESRGFALSRLLTQWEDVVGEDIASQAVPVRISYGRDGLGATLTLLVAGAAAPLVQMQFPRIRERVNGCYGYNAISRLKLTQTSASGFAESRAPFERPRQGAGLLPVDDQARRSAETLSREVRDDTLRHALEALGEKVLSRRQTKKG